ncbi:hypothetical protein CCF60_003127 [Salmonella enterica subsp. enterica serovar Berkeley]|nr:hypothetical protein [Salmonella enterica subsp. enterica serovar Berkeley]
MNKFTHIETIAAHLIVHSFDHEIGGVPAKAYVLEYNGNEFAVFTPIDETRPEVIVRCISKDKAEQIHGHYEGVFECDCTIEGILDRLGSDECICPECQKEAAQKKKQSKKVH